ncbi:MAG: hypothetical protein WD081_06255 [Gammaproteobacteria bacterium]
MITSLFSSAVLGAILVAPTFDTTAVFELSVDGEITIGTDGTVDGLTFDEGLQPVVRDAVEQQVRTWRFHPIVEDGRPVTAVARLWMTLSAKPKGDEVILSIADVRFGETVRMATQPKPPVYPIGALRQNVEGVVELWLLIGEGGKVAATHVYRTGVSTADRFGNKERRLRINFASAARAAAEHWQFDPPVRPGDTVGYRINFVISEDGVAQPNRWIGVHWSDPTPPPWQKGSEKVAELPENESRPMLLSSRIRLVDDVRGRVI